MYGRFAPGLANAAGCHWRIPGSAAQTPEEFPAPPEFGTGVLCLTIVAGYCSMICLTKPNAATIERVLDQQSRAAFNYGQVGLTRDSDKPPRGFIVNRCRTVIGHGEESFARAVTGIQQLRMLNLGWINVVPSGTKLAPNADVATLVRFFAGYALQVARVVYVIQEHQSTERRFGFGYGTLPEYPMRGEERFLVSFDETTSDVSFEIYSFSQPSSLTGMIGIPYLRFTQKRFARESADEMKRFVSARRGIAATN